MNRYCYYCGADIDPDDMEFVGDVAICGWCVRRSAEVEAERERQLLCTEPPRGGWYEETSDGFIVGATTRSTMVFYTIPFMCVCSGMTLGHFYWSQIAERKFSLLGSLCGLPFLVGTVWMLGYALLQIAGHVVVSVSDHEGTIFTGLGPFGQRKRFFWGSVDSVTKTTSYSHRGNPYHSIQIEAGRPISFGTLLSQSRQEFLIGTLRRALQQRGKAKVGHFDELLSA